MTDYKGVKLGAPIAQGDVFLFPIIEGEIPAGLNEHKVMDGQIIVTHSESGHHHVIDECVIDRVPNAVMLDTNDPLESWLSVKRPSALRHTKNGPDKHAGVDLPVGNYLVRRQREDSPEGWRRAID